MISKNNKQYRSELPAGSNVIIHQYPSDVEWIIKSCANLSENVWSIWIALGLVAITMFLTFPMYTDDYDIWFHLAYGKHYATNLTWHIDQTQFSWTPVDASKWIYGTWLGSTLMYIVYELGGITGLCVMQWIILISVFSLMIHYACLLQDRLDMFLAMCLILILPVLKLTQVYLKPQLISTLLFSITVFIYYYSVQLQHNKSRWYYLYPVIFLLWVNIHGEFIVGLAFLGVALTGELLTAIIDKNYVKIKTIVAPLGICIVLSSAVILINPDGLTYPISILKMWFTQRDAVSQANVSVLSMWGSVGFSMQNYNFVNTANAIVLMGIIYVIFCVAGLRKTRRINIPTLLINVVFFYISMKMARATVFFPIVWFYGMYTLVSELNLNEFKRKLAPFSMGIFAFVAFYSIYLLLITMPYATWFGYRHDDLMPKKEVEFIQKYHLPGPIFNDFLLGGYMMWTLYPEYKVWIDPRSGPYINEVLPDWLKIMSNLSDDNLKYLTNKYPFKIAMIGMWRTDVIFWLLKSPDWKLLYFDKAAAVIINKSVIPSLPPEALVTEVGTTRFVNLSNPQILSNLFQFYLAVGPVYARDIRNIFNQNVSDWLQWKKQMLVNMDASISQKEAELLQIKQQAAVNEAAHRQ